MEKPLDMIAEMNAAMKARPCNLGIDIISGGQWQTSEAGKEAIHVFRYALYECVSTGSRDGSLVAPLMGRFAQYDGGVTSIHLGGTSVLVCHPDPGVIYRFIPRMAATCEMELIWLARGDAEEGKDHGIGKPIWLRKVTTDEDKKIIEHTSLRVRSYHFVPGPIAPMEQNELRCINWYLEEISRPKQLGDKWARPSSREAMSCRLAAALRQCRHVFIDSSIPIDNQFQQLALGNDVPIEPLFFDDRFEDVADALERRWL